MRPMYETEQNKTAELKVATIVCENKGLSAVKLPKAYPIDFMFLKDSHPYAFAEVKVRSYTMEQMDRWGGFMLSLHKWATALNYSNIVHLNLIVIVEADGVIWYHKATGEIDGCAFGGRTDRNDEQDLEPVILLKMNRFKKLVDDVLN